MLENVATVKPRDEDGVVGSAAKTGRVVTVEDLLHDLRRADRGNLR
jgi:transketolase C-terminal domain/subunit